MTALRPVLRNRGGRWIGWSGATLANLQPSYWTAYEAINERLADAVAAAAGPGDFV